MRHRLLRPAGRAARGAVALVVSAALSATALTATALTSAAVSAARTASMAQAGQAQLVFLVTGEEVSAGAAGAPRVSIPAGAAGSAGQFQVLRQGGQTYVLPLTAQPYLGRSLDPRLFEVSALAKAETGGRLPVRVRYYGPAPALPGVTITSSGSEVARGYLTAAGARAFGAALGRQFDAGHSGGDGPGGLLRAGVSIALAGAPAAARQATTPAGATFTLTVRGTNLAGKPDTGDSVTIIDADNAGLLRHDFAVFQDGIATFTVPAGHFWVIGMFAQATGGRRGLRLDILPEITVTKNTTVQAAAAAATSKIQFLTARPTTVYSEIFEMDFLTDMAPRGCCSVSMDIFSIPGQGGGPIWVSPMPVAPRVGSLTQVTTAQLNSPPKAPGTPYQYDVTYQSPGVIPAQRFAVNQATLATEVSRFYSAIPQTGYLANFGAFPIQRRLGSLAILPRTHYPLHLTMYLTAGPGLTWETDYILWGRVLDFAGGQISRDQVFVPGQRLTTNWGAYPLHPAAATKLNQVSGAVPIAPSASRAGDVLGLLMGTFGDNTPGHTPFAVNAPFHATASYQLDQNGIKIAGGPLAHFHGYAAIAAALSPARSLIRFVLNAAQPATLSPLSTASQTTWAWWSSHEAGATLPPGWVCTAGRTRSCAVQPLLTLRYGVVGMGISGSASPGQQVLRLSVGHLQLAKAAPITRVAVSASFDGGTTWHPAQVTGSGTSYAAVFNAPAGAIVTLKTTATDAAGGSVTQIITNAYRTT